MKPKTKLFKIQELFTIYKGTRLTKDAMVEGSVNYLGAIDNNNGVRQQIDVVPKFQGNYITVNYNGSVGEAFYQQKPFWASDDVNVLELKGHTLNEKIAMYIITVIKANKYKFSYGRKWTMEKMYEEEILLPVDPIGNPDWKHMENHIDCLGIKLPKTKNNSKIPPTLDTQEWKEFKLSDVFTNIENCKCSSAEELLEDGTDLFYIGAKKTDNGVMRLVKKRNELLSRGNGIIFICDGQGSVGYSLYIDNDFIGSTTLSVGYNEKLNKYNAMFIVTVSDLERFKYSFGRKRKSTLNESKIKLPATSDGCLDWQFMENYIKSLPYSDVI